MKPICLATFVLLLAPALRAGTFSIGGAGGAIPDPAGTPGTWSSSTYTGTPFTSSVTVDNPVTGLSAVRLLGFTHSYRGDLHVLLRAPNGPVYNLVVRPGFTGSGSGDSGDCLLGDYTLVSSGGASLAQGATNISGGNYNLYFNSAGGQWGGASSVSLGSISGPAGTWTLEIRDWAALDAGSLTGWVLEGTDGPAQITSFCGYTDFNFSGCPCANNGAPQHGCNNSDATGGARLTGSGTLSPDTITLSISSARPAAHLMIFFQGDAVVAPSTTFGDGQRCAGGTLRRLYTKSVAGSINVPQPGDLSVSARSAQLGDTLTHGEVRYYQAFYRDPAPAFCPPATYNASNALAITW